MCVHVSVSIVCLCPSVFKEGFTDLAGRSALTDSHVGSFFWSAVQQHLYKHIFNLYMWQHTDHLVPLSSSHWSFYLAFFKVVTPGHGKCCFLPSNVELWWTNCTARVVYRMKQNKKQCWKMGAAVSFCKTINVACGGQKRLWPKPISRPAQLVYVVDVVGFSLCHERTYSNVYGY